MSKRTPIDAMLIIAVYAIYSACIYVAFVSNLPGQMRVTPPEGMDPTTGPYSTNFLAQFNFYSLLVMGISLVAALGWYVLGEWGPKAHSTSHGTWVLIWFMGLALTLAGGFLAIVLGPQPAENPYPLDAYYLCGGSFFYYLATMLFSPVNIKYTVPGSKIFRRW